MSKKQIKDYKDIEKVLEVGDLEFYRDVTDFGFSTVYVVKEGIVIASMEGDIQYSLPEINNFIDWTKEKDQ